VVFLGSLVNTWTRNKSNLTVVEHCGFRSFFESHSKGLGIHKWLHYFQVYEREFGRYCGLQGLKVRMVEIGVQSGGSIQMWLSRFGNNLELFAGVDVNPMTRNWTLLDERVHIEVGSQSDEALLNRLHAKYPDGFDIILDDGSHLARDMIATFEYAFANLLRPGGVYVTEDITQENSAFLSFVLNEYKHQQDALSLLEGLNNHAGQTPCCDFDTNGIQQDVEYIALNPMLFAIRKRLTTVLSLQAPRHGSEWIAYA